MAACLSFLRVPNIANTIAWYQAIGFSCLGTHQETGCELSWALLDWDGAQFMLYPEGRSDYAEQKDAGLYFLVDNIDKITATIKASNAELIEINPLTEYGKKEIVFKDLNGFQVTFGCDPE